MADIVTALDSLTQPTRAPRRRPSHLTLNHQPDDSAYDAVIAQIQYDVMERAYFQRTLLSPLPPTLNGKLPSPCWTCNHLTFLPPTSTHAKALRTEAMHGVLPCSDEARIIAAEEVPTCWFPRRHKPAAWDLHDDVIRAGLHVKALNREREERHEALKDTVKLLSQRGVGAPWQRQLAEIAKVRAELAFVSAVDTSHRNQLVAFAVRAADVILRRGPQLPDLSSVYLASFTH